MLGSASSAAGAVGRFVCRVAGRAGCSRFSCNTCTHWTVRFCSCDFFHIVLFVVVLFACVVRCFVVYLLCYASVLCALTDIRTVATAQWTKRRRFATCAAIFLALPAQPTHLHVGTAKV